MTTVNQALDKIRGLSGQRVGNGQCYGLSSYYSNLLKGAGLGAGIGSIHGNVGDTIKAANIGSAYDWLSYGWSVVYPSKISDFRPGGIINIKANQGAPFYTGVYGHTGIITAVNGTNITLHEQNAFGKEYVVEQVYRLDGTFISQIASIVYPPNVGVMRQARSGLIKLKDETGTMTVTVDKLNVRDVPSLKGKVVHTYETGESFNYDSLYIGEGYIWASYIGSSSGLRRYVAVGVEKDGRNIQPYGTFK